MQDYKKHFSQNAGSSSSEPMLASVWLIFSIWKNASTLKVKCLTNASWIIGQTTSSLHYGTCLNPENDCHRKFSWDETQEQNHSKPEEFVFCSYWDNTKN